VHSDISILPDFRPLPDDEFTRSLIKKLQMYDYPLPITLEGGMRLLYGFEEEFAGDIPDDLPLSVYSHASQCVVSLASFRGDCTVTIYKAITYSMFDFLPNHQLWSSY